MRRSVVMRFSRRGSRRSKDGPARLEAAREAYRAEGAKAPRVLPGAGKYERWLGPSAGRRDGGQLSIALGARGNVRSKTPYRAFAARSTGASGRLRRVK